MTQRTAFLILLLLLLPGGTPPHAGEQNLDKHYVNMANIPFPGGFPSEQDVKRLTDELLYQRAVQTYLWALPALNLFAMKEGKEQTFGHEYSVMPVWKGRINAKTRIATPNTDVIYGMTFLDLAENGPTVIEVPPGLQGILDDAFQRPVPSENEIHGKRWSGDVGFPGPDGGKGGKYLLLPPDHREPPPEGYFVFRPKTNTVMIFWRGFFTDPASLDETTANIEKTRIHPLGDEQNAPGMLFPDATGVEVDMLYPKNGAAFEMLSRIVDRETVLPEDMEMRGMLAAIGIAKGKPFAPDPRTRELLDAAARTANNYMHALVYGPPDPEKLWYEDRMWLSAFVGNAEFAADTHNLVDDRTVFFANAYSTSPGMAVEMEDAGAKYLSTFRDATGNFLSGEHAYKLTVPANAPAKLFWSVTAYDPASGALLDNGQPFPSVNSLDGPTAAGDGSVEVHFGPEPPGAGKNWIRTLPGRGFFIILRLYAPTRAFFAKLWKPGDLERLP